MKTKLTGRSIPPSQGGSLPLYIRPGQGPTAREKRRRMPPHLQQKRIGADSRDERRHACADVTRLGVQGNFHQQAHRPAGCRPSKDAVS